MKREVKERFIDFQELAQNILDLDVDLIYDYERETLLDAISVAEEVLIRNDNGELDIN